ncbi:unnamed protein product [Vitrella brassicaformis CCMP3155]|uniref:TAP42-like protein n=2 Tax=Vitrella brassicaformis TaxID=1169539 RepID=A0A0G4G8T3_VITBC|nr:unnamed protein product [Vitrella brassicaformis CCMP3155]|eukprot:CEM25133.1 unnamed protein product [Vitrella brassicaformis CCMP3155]
MNELSATFNAAFTEYLSAYSSLSGGVPVTDQPGVSGVECLEGLVARFRQVAAMAEGLDVVSDNEELDDISTASLKYLMVPFVLGDLSTKVTHVDDRLDALNDALVYFHRFLARMQSLGVGGVDQWLQSADNEEEPEGPHPARPDPATDRTRRIERYRQQKELDSRIQRLFALRQRTAREKVADPHGERDEHDWGKSVDEENERLLLVSLLERSAAAAMAEVEQIRRELPMLERFLADRRQVQEARQHRQEPTRSAPASSQQRPGLASLMGQPSELRQLYRQAVLRPSHRLPTISLAQCADMEMAIEVHEMGAQPGGDIVQTYTGAAAQGSGNDHGKEEDDRVDEQQEKKDRDWDDWKDDHPKGSGNKMVNIG